MSCSDVMPKRIFVFVLLFFVVTFKASAAALIFDWKASSTTWESSGSWTETNGTGSYPGASGRTTDIVRFAVTGSTSYTVQPTLASSITVASIEFGGGFQLPGTKITVGTTLVPNATLTVGTITQDINTTTSTRTSGAIYDYLQGTGTVNVTTITLGVSGTSGGFLNYFMSDVATLNVSGNVVLNSNVNSQNGSGFRLEDGDMYLTGQVIFSSLPSAITVYNATYFTINTKTQANSTATDPHLYLLNANPVPSIPTPHASANFYGDHGGVSTVTYTAANPKILTTSTGGFGSGGGTIDPAQPGYDNLIIDASGTAVVGGGSAGTLNVGGDLTTKTTTTFGTAATTTIVAGSWTNSTTVTGGAGNTTLGVNLTNSGTMNMSTGSIAVGQDLSNTGTFKAGDGDITVGDDFSNSSKFTLSTGDLSIAGDYTNSAGATFTAGTGTVYFDGTAAEALADNSTSGTTFNNVDFSGGGIKTMSGSGSFGVSGTGVLTMEASTQLKTGNILTLVSTATSTASVNSIPSTSSITGNVNVQRYISGGTNTYRGYRFLSSPVYTTLTGGVRYWDLNYLMSYAPITGTLGILGGMTKTGNPSMYVYRDNVAFTNKAFNTGNFRGINKINNLQNYVLGVDFDTTSPNTLNVGTGILFFYRGNLNNISTKYTTTTVAEANVFVSVGVLNQQAVTVVNWYTGLSQLQKSTVTGNTGYSGYNLVGNPYACSINWGTYSTSSATAGIYAPGVGKTIYIYNETTKVYATYDGTNGINGGSATIPSGQGFFVRADPTSSTTPTLTFNEAAKVTTQLVGPTTATGSNDLLLDAKSATASVGPQYMRLELQADSINKVETIIRLERQAKNEFVNNEDSQYFIGGGVVGLASLTKDNYQAAINVIPYPTTSQAVGLTVAATASGLYKLNLTEFKNVPALFDVWLMDKYNKDSLDIKHNPTYAFNIVLSDTNTYGSGRFQVVIRQNAALGVHLLNFAGTKAAAGANLVWKTENEDSYTNFTVERSVDKGVTYVALDSLASASLGDYTLLDKSPVLGTDMYRLKITDLNGAVTYSKVVTLMYGNNTTGNITIASNINVYPNPAVGTINLSINTAAAAAASSNPLQSLSTTNSTTNTGTATSVYGIKIVSQSGAVIKTATSATPAWQDNISTLTPGIYFIEVVNNNDKSLVGKSKFVKL